MRRYSTRRTKREGFTLMEMLVVLAILVLLMGLVVPKILGTQKKADINAAKTQIGMLKGALERYTLDMRDFPPTESGLQALVQPVSSGEMGNATSTWDGPYINSPELPTDPWGSPYQYEYPPTRGMGEYPDIWSFGPDGADNTEDDITSWGSAVSGGEGGGEFGEDGFDDFDDGGFDDFDAGGMDDFSEPMEYDDLGL